MAWLKNPPTSLPLDKIWILAGSHAQARNYQRELRLPPNQTEIITGASLERLRGLGPSIDLHFVGTWRSLPEGFLREIHYILALIGGRNPTPFEEWIERPDPALVVEEIFSDAQGDYLLRVAAEKDLTDMDEYYLTVLADIASGAEVRYLDARLTLTNLYRAPRKAEPFVPDLFL